MNDNLKEIPAEELVEVRKVLGRFAAPKADAQIFYDLCFAICAPQTKFEQNKPVIEELASLDFFETQIPDWVLRETITPVRFFNVKADRLIAAKKQFPLVLAALQASERSAHEKRMYLKSMIAGLGMKTTSHFLRNQGHQDLAIIDTHILKFLGEEKKSSIGVPKYLRLEAAFGEICSGMGVSPAELDTYLWKTYSGTEWKDFVF